MRSIKKNSLFKPFENPTFVYVVIGDREIPVKITLLKDQGLRFTIEFIVGKRMFKQELKMITEINKIYALDDIQVPDLEMDQFSKAKIAACLNEILDFHFS
jgi:hypothetical protein